MKCPKCNVEIPESSKFCLHCGEKIIKEKKFLTQKCKNCGASMAVDIDDTMSICPYCGNDNLIFTVNDVKKEGKKFDRENISFYQIKKGKILIAIICFLVAFVPLKKCNSNNMFGSLRWNGLLLSSQLPAPESNKINIHDNDIDSLRVNVEDINVEDYYNYVEACKTAGYTLGSSEDSNVYSAYNSERYYLKLYYYPYSEEINIDLDAPLFVSDIDWNNHSISSLLITPPSTIGSILKENKEQIEILVVLSNDDEYESYRNDVINLGYTIESLMEDKAYSAFNDKGSKVELSYISGSKEMKVLYKYPVEFENFIWPTVGIATLAPVPNSFSGKTINHYDWTFSAYINNITKDQYKYYVQKCIEKGFDKDISDYGESFYADHWWYNDVDITVSYKGFNTMYVHISGSLDNDYSWRTRKMSETEREFYEKMNSGNNEDGNSKENNTITLDVDLNELTSMNYTEVKEKLSKLGFTNIEIYSEITDEEAKSNKVYAIALELNGKKIEIIKNQQYSKDSKISIKYYEYEESEQDTESDEGIITSNVYTSQLLFKDFDDVKNLLLDVGFTNFKTYSTITKDESKANKVIDVQIKVDGAFENINKDQKYQKDSQISIEYYKYEKPESVSYSTNDEVTVKLGNQGIYSYKDSGSYDVYWIIDFDDGYVYSFTEGNGDDSCTRFKIASGDLNTSLKICYDKTGDGTPWYLHFNYKNSPSKLIVNDHLNNAFEYIPTNLSSAWSKLKTKKMIDA